MIVPAGVTFRISGVNLMEGDEIPAEFEAEFSDWQKSQSTVMPKIKATAADDGSVK